MTFNNTTISNSIDVAANGRSSSIPFVDQFESRDPTPSDIQYPIQKKWLNTSTGAFWELQNFLSFNGITTAHWVLIGNQAAATETLTGNDGIAVPPTGNNINVLGDVTNITTTGNAGTSTMTIHLNGNIATTYVEDVGSATPSSHVLNVLGTNGVTTTGSGNTITIGLTGGSTAIDSINVDAHTAPGTDPVLPDTNGLITVTGGQVAAGTTTNVIRTDSLAANTYTIEVQRSQAVASSTVGDNGVSHFDSGIFSVDANAFVSLSTSFYQTGTWTPVLKFGGATTGITYSVQMGQYTRIGNLLFYEYRIILTSKGSATGLATVTGLPLAAGSTLGAYQTPGSCGGLTFDAGASNFQNIIVASTSIIQLWETTPFLVQQLTDSNFTSPTASFGGEGFYYLT